MKYFTVVVLTLFHLGALNLLIAGANLNQHSTQETYFLCALKIIVVFRVIFTKNKFQSLKITMIAMI